MELQARYEGAVEMLGEKAEREQELLADLEDVRLLYREQIDVMATQLAAALGGEPA